MKIITNLATSVYLWIIGLTLGAILASGVFTAPVIFGAAKLLPHLEIGRFDSGILMTQVFIKLGKLLTFTAILLVIYELVAFIFSKKSWILLVLGIVSAVLCALFALYYTPEIINMQAQGADVTGSKDFGALHKQSSMVFHALFLTLSVSFIWRIFKMR